MTAGETIYIVRIAPGTNLEEWGVFATETEARAAVNTWQQQGRETRDGRVIRHGQAIIIPVDVGVGLCRCPVIRG